VCARARLYMCMPVFVCLHVGGRRTRSMKREKIHEEHIAKHLHQAKHLHKAYLAVLAHEVHEHKEHQEEHVRSTTCNKQPLDHLQQTTKQTSGPLATNQQQQARKDHDERFAQRKTEIEERMGQARKRMSDMRFRQVCRICVWPGLGCRV